MRQALLRVIRRVATESTYEYSAALGHAYQPSFDPAIHRERFMIARVLKFEPYEFPLEPGADARLVEACGSPRPWPEPASDDNVDEEDDEDVNRDLYLLGKRIAAPTPPSSPPLAKHQRTSPTGPSP